MNKVFLVFGTRPEAIKMCPLVKELQNNGNIEVIVCVTGQHREMLKQVLDVFEVTPKYDLDIMKKNQTLFDVTTDILIGLKGILELEKPNLVLVHGDTTTTFAASLASFYLKIPVGHIEAGLRTHDIYSPFPEEFNRQATGIIASLHFAPTERAKMNLVCENKDEKAIYVTGNTGIDALKNTVRSDYTHPLFEWVGSSRLILLTAHRRENLGKPLYNMFSAVKRVVDEYEDVKVVYPIHMNPQVREVADKIFQNHDRIMVIEPLGVIDFHNFINKSYLILTDSGGIQEEAPSLGKPVLVMRENTERPEGVLAGTLKLVGTRENDIYNNFKSLLDNQELYNKMSEASNPFGDGNASKRIVDIIKREILNIG